MKIDVFASSSKGNCYRISDGYTSILIDAGIPFKEIAVKSDFRISDIDACLISHCHKDHSLAARDLAKNGIDVYTSQGTIAVLGLKLRRINAIEALGQFQIGTFDIMPFDVQHDAPEPLGFLIQSVKTNEKILYMTDTFYVKYKFKGLTHLLIECNYSEKLLSKNIDAGRVPAELALRVRRSHMSIEHLVEFFKANDTSTIQQVYLMHLSNNNSDAEYFKRIVQQETGAEVYIC